MHGGRAVCVHPRSPRSGEAFAGSRADARLVEEHAAHAAPAHAAVDWTTWWIGILFAIGSTCFLVGPFPGFVELVGSEADAMVFFVGSIFFTAAAALQYVDGGLYRPRSLGWWSNPIQLVGTLFF